MSDFFPDFAFNLALPVRWAHAQFATWRSEAPYDFDVLACQLDQAAAASPMVFLYDFCHNYVSLRPKDLGQLSTAGASSLELVRRATLYRDLFQDVLTRCGSRHRFTLAVDIDDHPRDGPEMPVFSFQKKEGSRLILLPDIDLLTHSFFIGADYEDELDFSSKLNAAVFAGATTGGNITSAVVDSLALPRLRSAMFFRGMPDIQFTLPKIVQCDGPKTVSKIEGLGISGPEIPWREQLKFRYLLSIDGNGATCSRVAAALHSRSALLKYESSFLLYYFMGLSEGANFIQIRDNQDVVDFLNSERGPGSVGQGIAEGGRMFARRYLSRPSVSLYVAHLLDAYGNLLGTPGSAGDELSFLIDSFGHVENTGDVWAGPGGWLGAPSARFAIEGFGVQGGATLEPLEICYQGLLDDGSPSEVCVGGTFCGSRGCNRPLRGFRVWLTGSARLTFELSCEAKFKDGQHVGLVSDGSFYKSEGSAELVALRVSVRRREGSR